MVLGEALKIMSSRRDCGKMYVVGELARWANLFNTFALIPLSKSLIIRNNNLEHINSVVVEVWRILHLIF